MMREMDAVEFQGWKYFDDVEPMGEERADFRSAHIVQTIINTTQNVINTIFALAGQRPPKVDQVTIDQCMLSIGDRLSEMKRIEDERQTPEEIESYLTTWFDGINTRFKK